MQQGIDSSAGRELTACHRYKNDPHRSRIGRIPGERRPFNCLKSVCSLVQHDLSVSQRQACKLLKGAEPEDGYFDATKEHTDRALRFEWFWRQCEIERRSG